MSNKILVVGGAGYIGSHMVLTLRQNGYIPIVLDNLSTGHRDAVLDAELIVGDMNDTALLMSIMKQHEFKAIMHFASYIEVGESVRLPFKYYQNNVCATLNLLEVMLKNNVKHFIFSSTAAVYGEPKSSLITESHPLAPVNPYGRSKWMVEEMLKDFAKSDGLRYAVLRYFNAAGADQSARLAERHEPESHIIPTIFQVLLGQRHDMMVFGHDYPTADGTCIRDFIHVTDLCQAHLLALQVLLNKGDHIICNLGTGRGYSVLEVIQSVSKVLGKRIPFKFGPRRLGDVAILVADATRAQQLLQWAPQYSDLDTIVDHAFRAYISHHQRLTNTTSCAISTIAS